MFGLCEVSGIRCCEIVKDGVLLRFVDLESLGNGIWSPFL